jgi:hypothetical protein
MLQMGGVRLDRVHVYVKAEIQECVRADGEG